MKKTIIFTTAALMTFVMVSCGSKNNKTVQCTPISPSPTSGDWIDLGLPSGLLWYSVNLGATAPEEYGDYYAWGETHPKNVYNWRSYAYATTNAKGKLENLTKYNTSTEFGTIDNLTTLQASDDVATQQLGSDARIPTIVEWRELFNNTTVEWTSINGVKGRKFTSTNGKSLFLPAAGNRLDTIFNGADTLGYYRSASLYESSPFFVWYIGFHSDYQVEGCCYRCDGRSVRAVRRRSQN